MARRTRGFSLLEMIVVLIVIAVLSALTIPRFAAVTGRSGESTYQQTLLGVARNAAALVDLDRSATPWPGALATSVSELPAAAGPGQWAATSWQLLADDDGPDPSTGQLASSSPADLDGEIAFVWDPGTGQAVLVTRAPSGRAVYVSVLQQPSIGHEFSAAVVAGNGLLDPRAMLGVDLDDDGALTGVPPAPSITAVTAAPGALDVTFAHVAGALSYTVDCTPGQATHSPGSSAAGEPQTVTVTGLAGGTATSCTVTAHGTGGSATSAPVAGTPGSTAVHLPYTTAAAQDGLIDWLGTNGGTEAFQNPGTTGRLNHAQTTAFSSLDGAFDKNNTTTRGSLNGGTSPYYLLDLGARRMNVTHVAFQNRWDGSNALRNWVLEASNDETAVGWMPLHTASGEGPVGAGVWRAWELSDPGAYRYFRIRMTGADSSGQGYHQVASMDLWGTVHTDTVAAPVGSLASFDPPGSTLAARQGLFHWLGTNAGAAAYQNPVSTHRVEVNMGSLFQPPAAMFDNDLASRASTNGSGGYTIDLGNHRRFAPSSMVIGSWSENRPRGFTISASNDNSTWTVLRDLPDLQRYRHVRSWEFWLGQTTGYRYFRIVPTSPNSSGSGHLQIAELEMYGHLIAHTPGQLAGTTSVHLPDGTFGGGYLDNGGISPTASQSSTWSSHGAHMAIDRNFSNRASTNSGAAQWWQVDFGAGNGLRPYAWAWRADAVTESLSSWTLQGSNDAASWVDLDVHSSDPIRFQAAGWSLWHIQPPVEHYRYLRICSPGTAYLQIGDVEFYGEAR